MADLIVGLVVGLALGVAVGLLVRGRRPDNGAELATAAAARAAAETRATDLAADLERERAEHQAQLDAIERRFPDQFSVLAQTTLANVVRDYQASQIQAIEQREAKLDERLTPLRDLLVQYRDKVEQLEQRREVGYQSVKDVADRLLEAQRTATTETQRLNTILGRADARGRWGEVQLERILEMSGMLDHIDFERQMTVSSESGAKRPDVVVKLPGDAKIAIDAKVPYAAFDRALDATEPAEREAALREFAGAVRGHINDLKKKSYYESIGQAPAFTVCFVPSDQLLATAYAADPDLLNIAHEARVLLAGPTALLAMLWAGYLGWSQFRATQNIEEIQELAEEIVKRTGTLFDHIERLGKNLGKSVDSYNDAVGSIERQLLVTVRKIQEKGIKEKTKVDTLPPIRDDVRPLDAGRWPVAPSPDAPTLNP